MGQKVNPHGLRVGVIKDWDSKWYAEADFADCLVEDYNMRKFLKKKLFSAGISKLRLSVHLTELRLSSTPLSQAWLSVRVVLKSRS